MRIAIFSEVYTPYIGGLSSVTSDLMDSMTIAGNETLVISPNPKVNGFDLQDNVLLCPAQKSNNDYGFMIDKSREDDLLIYVKNFKPDIIHINSISQIGLIALNVANKLDIPTVVYINELPSKESISLLTSIKFKNTLKRLVNNSDVVVCVSKFAQNMLNELKIEKKTLICPMAVNTEFFDCNKILPVKTSKVKSHFGLNDASLIAVFSGFLTKEKDLDRIFNIWARNFSIDENIRLLVVGDGPYKTQLMSMTKDISIQKQVVFTGAVRRDKMPLLLSMCNIYVSSCTNDITSVSMLEALSCGIPAIIPASSPNLSELKEGITGFSYNDDKDLVKYIRRFNSLDEQGKKILRNLVRKNAMENKAVIYAKKMNEIYKHAMQVHFFHSSSSQKSEEKIEEINVFEDEMTDISDYTN